MKDNIKYRIVKVTLGDKSSWYEVQEKTWFGKWNTCHMNKIGETTVLFDVPAQFELFEDAEKFAMRNLVAPIIEVVKEY